MNYYTYKEITPGVWERIGPVFDTETAANNWLARHPNQDAIYQVLRFIKPRRTFINEELPFPEQEL